MNAKDLHTKLAEVEQWYGLQRYERATIMLIDIAAEISEDNKRGREIAAKINPTNTLNRGYRK